MITDYGAPSHCRLPPAGAALPNSPKFPSSQQQYFTRQAYHGAEQHGSPNVTRKFGMLARACQTTESSSRPHPIIGLQSSTTKTTCKLSRRFQIRSGALTVKSQALRCSTSSHRLISPAVTTHTRTIRVIRMKVGSDRHDTR
jgi:hypothetical protein